MRDALNRKLPPLKPIKARCVQPEHPEFWNQPLEVIEAHMRLKYPEQYEECGE